MDSDATKNEIKTLLNTMGFAEELVGIETYQGVTSRFSIRVAGDSLKYSSEEKERRIFDNTAEEYSDRREPENHGSHSPRANLLIGNGGSNLTAFEHVLKKIIKKKYGEHYKFTLDINDYQMRKLEDLKQDVKVAAKDVRAYKKHVPLGIMSSFERRIVHLLLAEYPDITTESVGEEPCRRVIIKPYP